MQKKKSRGKKIAVTFEMHPDPQVDTLYVAGDFNEWDTSATPMKRQKNGTWSATVPLDPGTYHYRYVANGQTWQNDPAADRYEPSDMGAENSVVVVEPM